MANPSVQILEQAPPILNKSEPPRCGAPTEPREVSNSDNALFEKYRDIIEGKIQALFGVPKDFKLGPSKVRTQVVAGTNYYFHVRLPNDQFAHVRIFEPLKSATLENRDRSAFVTVEEQTQNS